MVLTDVLARYSRLRHPLREVVFSTGTDEHGLKIQQAAKDKNTTPLELCDRLSARFEVRISALSTGLFYGLPAAWYWGYVGTCIRRKHQLYPLYTNDAA